MPRRISIFIFTVILLQACYLLGPSPRKRLKQCEKIKPIDVAIVPGLPLYHGQWDTLLKTRMLWSVYLYKKGYVKNIIFSGNAVYTKWREGCCMADIAKKLGVKEEHIFVDTLAEHSTENLFYGNELAKQKGFKTVALASDPFQCGMLHKFARKKMETKIHFLPVIFDSIQNDFYVNVILDTTLNTKPNFIPLEERQSQTQRLKGTRGRNIK
jgi:uncharacterized SAM-binding protein YcdF (DUF218 family)